MKKMLIRATRIFQSIIIENVHASFRVSNYMYRSLILNSGWILTSSRSTVLEIMGNFLYNMN